MEEEKGVWGPGSPRQLLERLNLIAEALKTDTKARNWPKAANTLTRRLREVKTTLREVDIMVTIDTDSKTNTRIVTIQKTPPVSPEPPEAQNQAQTTLSTAGDTTGDTSGDTSGQT